MSRYAYEADSVRMDSETRGNEIKRRRLALDIKSVHEFHRATKVSREAITNAEDGEASPGTYDRLEAALDRLEEEMGMDDPDGGQITFRLISPEGVHVAISGPAVHLSAMEHSVANLIHEMGLRHAELKSEHSVDRV